MDSRKRQTSTVTPAQPGDFPLWFKHRLCPPRHPQTNGMVERFNGRISEVVKQTRFASAAELETTLERYVKTYNQLIPQRALNHLSPIQALKEWQKKKPKLFKKRVYNQPGLDTQPCSACRARMSRPICQYSSTSSRFTARVARVVGQCEAG